MENINTKGVTEAIEKKLIQPHLIIQALVFTSILYFSVGETPPDTIGETYQSVQTSVSLSASISNSVLQYASHHSGLPTSALHIVQAQRKTWSDNCLGLASSGILCTQMQVPGWQVAVASNQQRWIYRTNASGSMIKLESGTALPNQEGKAVALK